MTIGQRRSPFAQVFGLHNQAELPRYHKQQS